VKLNKFQAGPARSYSTPRRNWPSIDSTEGATLLVSESATGVSWWRCWDGWGIPVNWHFRCFETLFIKYFFIFLKKLPANCCRWWCWTRTTASDSSLISVRCQIKPQLIDPRCRYIFGYFNGTKHGRKGNFAARERAVSLWSWHSGQHITAGSARKHCVECVTLSVKVRWYHPFSCCQVSFPFMSSSLILCIFGYF